jgi:DNA (cytosine-5)-methyltransferase 1|tara:strand:+ start:84 stop:992 length:909 start_codon:yes stop_codon:yes gene_type:complete
MGKKLTFVDLFAGIGGFHLALKSLDMQCVFACEIDEYARKTYLANFKDKFLRKENLFPKDVWEFNIKKIPKFDILCAGFPCQPFSQAGRKRGFQDKTSGNLFFAIENIIKQKKPAVALLENVSFLKNHDKGRTFKKILRSLKKLNYTFDYKILRASEFGLPQHRPRIYMVCFNKNKIKKKFHKLSFDFPKKQKLKTKMSDILGGFCSIDLMGKKERKIGFTLRVGGRRSGIKDRRNWDRYIVDKKIVELKPEKGLLLMGLNKNFKLPVSDNQALKLLGNSVPVNVVKEIAKSIKIHLKKYSN